MAILARDSGFSGIIVPERNAAEASVVKGLDVRAVASLSEAVAVLTGEESSPRELPLSSFAGREEGDSGFFPHPDFAEVKGQEHA